MPQVEWEDTTLTAKEIVSDTTRQQKDESWLLEGEMEVKHGKKWFRKLKRMKYFETEQIAKGLYKYLDVEVTASRIGEKKMELAIEKQAELHNDEEEKTSRQGLHDFFAAAMAGAGAPRKSKEGSRKLMRSSPKNEQKRG